MTAGLIAAVAIGAGPAAAAPQVQAAASPPVLAVPDAPLRTFRIDKTPDELARQADRTRRAAPPPVLAPGASDLLRVTFGVGYVQDADWGAELGASGAVAGRQVHLASLVTHGLRGTQLDYGMLSVADPDAGWRAEAGDLYSPLRSVARGARLSWRSWGGRQPSLAVYAARPGQAPRPTVVAYRDRIQFGPVTLVDAEVASDRSYFARSRLALGRFDFEASYRRGLRPEPAIDRAAHAAVRVWRGIGVRAGALVADRPGERFEWGTVALRLPLTRHAGLTLERSLSRTDRATHALTAAMANVRAGQVQLFHRYQWGESEFLAGDLGVRVDRQQLQSMASYAAGSRVNLTLQLATEWSPLGEARHFEELQLQVRPFAGTAFTAVGAFPDVSDARRLRVRLTQALPWRFSIQAEYGRLSAFQTVPQELEQARYKVMLRHTAHVRTPARGGDVRGTVLDQLGRPVAGVRVRLGAYSADTDATGGFTFSRVPRGSYDLWLDEQHVPADYASDGRRLRVAVGPSSREVIDLRVAPLNAIHGTVYVDRNGNGQFDLGEEAAGVPLQLGDRTTSTDRLGAYSFYNLPPGAHVIRLPRDRLPALYDAIGPENLVVSLDDGRPATGADFRVVEKTKPVIWREPIRR